MNTNNFLISAFSFLDTIETFLRNDLDNDTSLAIGKFEFKRIMNFYQQNAAFNLWFTDEETRVNQQIATINVKCASHQENQYAFKGCINFLTINKEHPFTVIVDSPEKLKSYAFKLSIYCKSFITEALEGKIKEGVPENRPNEQGEELPVIDAREKEFLEIERKKKERTIQMSPQDLQKELFAEAAVEEKRALTHPPIPMPTDHKPLEMSAEDIEKMLFSSAEATPSPTSEPASKKDPQGATSPSPDSAGKSNQPPEMSAEEIEKMLSNPSSEITNPESPASNTTPAATPATNQDGAKSQEPEPAAKEQTSNTSESADASQAPASPQQAEKEDEDFIKQLQSQLTK
ncbi:MAG: hypothetical protein A2007_02260 [Verrucomicrobia bacterium GWC2_42_7]|nr:MAG: hypothetical protein A2007_02260 [Verrucomicrobia bacterium GWC2_42_7]